MSKKKSRAELLAENRLLRQSNNIEAVASTIRHVTTIAGFVVIAFLVNDSIKDLAGQTTDAAINIGFLADIRFSQAVAWIFGVSGLVYGRAQSRMKKKTAGRLGKRLQELESKLDPGRTSSKIGD